MSRWLGFSIQHNLTEDESKEAAVPVGAPELALPRRGSEEERQRREQRAARALSRMVGVSEELLRTKPPIDWRQTQVELQSLRELPSLKTQAKRFASLVAGEDCPLDDLIEEVGRDPALAVNVLRLANSVSVGSRERVDDLPTALHLLGVARVRRMASLLAAMGDARGVAPGFDWSELWMHSAACAALAERLATWSGLGGEAQAHLAGLLHDVGKIALSTVAPDAYRAVLVIAWSRREELVPLEQARLGLDHREAGWIFGQEADLPPAVLSAVAHHDAPERAPAEHRGLVALVALANRLTKEYELGFGGDGWVRGVWLKDEPACAILQAAVGRELNFSELEYRVATEWLDPIKTELAILGTASSR